MGTGSGLFLIAVGAILLFAVPAGSLFGLNLHVVGIIVAITGFLGLLLPGAAGVRGRTGCAAGSTPAASTTPPCTTPRAPPQRTWR